MPEVTLPARRKRPVASQVLELPYGENFAAAFQASGASRRSSTAFVARDPGSYLAAAPSWTPGQQLPTATAGAFTITDLLTLAGRL